ncbi:MAG: 1-acyl-sn-glycerol-3-phosphate acyltransferase [Propionibacteriales bacterium]|nr:1-acyl-sn-glycerol-3-phosphate acyltransferase [Propionibacteriales bacterium]
MLYRIIRLVLLPLVRVIWRPVVEGRDRVPLEGPVILASNHLSLVDSIVIPLVAPRRVSFLAKAEYFTGRGVRRRLFGWLLSALGAIPVDRGAHRTAQASLESALRVLTDGGAFGIYPEGTRSRDGRLYRGKTGVAWLALTAGCPVVPAALAGTDRIQPVGSWIPRAHRVTVRFGPPLVFSELHGQARSGLVRRQVTDEIMAAIAALSGQERAATYNDGPGTET